MRKKIKPHETYEGLLKQFHAVNRLREISEDIAQYYKQKVNDQSEENLKELKRQIESEKDMNHSLSQENIMLTKELDALKNNVH